jgi:hypothetical protein
VPEFEDCLRQAMAIRGALGASLIDHVSGTTVAFAGRERAATAGPAEVARATIGGAAFAPQAVPGHVEDIVITAANGYHLLHFVITALGARLVLYLWLDRMLGNLAMTQRALRAIGHGLVAS